VLDSAACLADAQLEARGHFIALEGVGISTTIEATRSRLSRTPARADETPPTLGRDTQEVLEMLGYDSDRISELVIAGVLG
jgi:crotonobetainyl-CoA:carnitine CoA-transferase CaiB-like acyl-CoA transferase